MPTYIVKAGDTLERIAMRECGDRRRAAQIARDNQLQDMHRIYIGQRLELNCTQASPEPQPMPTIPTEPEQPAKPGAPADIAPDKRFRVIVRSLTVRSAPDLSPQARTGNFLRYGDEITVEADAWQANDGYMWWRHSLGWSAEATLNGTQRYLQDLTPQIPRARPGGQPATPPVTGPVEKPVELPPGKVWLRVPYHSQEDQDARWAGADCGPTCIRMLIGWDALRRGRPDPNISVDEVSQKTGMGRYRFSFPRQLVTVGARYGLKLVETRSADMNRVIAELDAGRPVISLIRYGSIPGRQNVTFRGGHFVVVIGYDDHYIYLNDPDWWGDLRDKGAGFAVTRANFERAIGADSWKAGNPPYWAVLVSPEHR